MADLSFIVVFGTRWHFKVTPGGWDGTLNCPQCKVPHRMVQQHAYKAFTLYWWPLFRTEDGGQLLQCTGCGVRFHLPPELGGPGERIGAPAPSPLMAEPMGGSEGTADA